MQRILNPCTAQSGRHRRRSDWSLVTPDAAAPTGAGQDDRPANTPDDRSRRLPKGCRCWLALAFSTSLGAYFRTNVWVTCPPTPIIRRGPRPTRFGRRNPTAQRPGPKEESAMRQNFFARIFKGKPQPGPRLLAVTSQRTGERTLLGVENLRVSVLASVMASGPFEIKLVSKKCSPFSSQARKPY